MRCPELEIQMDEKRNDKPGRGAKPNRREDRKRDFSRREREDAPENMLEGRNAVTEALSAGRTIDKLFVADGDTDRARWQRKRARWLCRPTGGSSISCRQPAHTRV